jgi:phosphatidylserine/phosphatidylglycerophosphate/cardiolipin synthase-like enzyme
MTPQIVAAILKYFWDQYTTESSTGRRKRKKTGRMRLMAMMIAGLTAVGYFKNDTVHDFINQQAAVVGGLLENKLKSEIPALSGLATAAAGDGPIRVYFTKPPGDPNDPNDIAHACVGYIDAAKQTLDVAGFEIDNKLIIAALIQAKQRGVTVRVVTDTDYVDETQGLQNAGIQVVQDRRSALMHNKFIVFDGSAVWMGSMNFTENCAYRNNNNGVYLAVPQLAENYTTKFKWMFEEKLFGKKPRGANIPNPMITLPDGTILENYFAPHDECAQHLIELIGPTQKTLDFLAFSFTHKGIGQAVADRSKAGVAVRGVFETSQAKSVHSEYNKFKDMGLTVYLDGNPRNMHHKVMVLDGTTTVTGSFNFSESADRSNDENLLFIKNNPTVAAQFTAEVGRVVDVAKNAHGGQ